MLCDKAEHELKILNEKNPSGQSKKKIIDQNNQSKAIENKNQSLSSHNQSLKQALDYGSKKKGR